MPLFFFFFPKDQERVHTNRVLRSASPSVRRAGVLVDVDMHMNPRSMIGLQASMSNSARAKIWRRP